MQTILNASLAGLAALFVVAMQGSLWVAMRNPGDVEARALGLASICHWAVCAIAFGLVLLTLNARPGFGFALAENPRLWFLAVTAMAGLFGVRECLSMNLPGPALLSSVLFMVGVASTGAVGLAR